jgi:hypothetical protein
MKSLQQAGSALLGKSEAFFAAVTGWGGKRFVSVLDSVSL